MKTYDDSIFFIFFIGQGFGGGGVYVPKLDFSDARNSFYRAMGL